MFFDVVPSDVGRRLETRIYHEESGSEVVFPGSEPDLWTAWILERIHVTERDVDMTPGPPTAMEFEASISIIGTAPPRARTVRFNARGGDAGHADLERELGAAFVRAVAQLLDMGEG